MGGFFSQIGELYVVHHLWGRLETLQGPPSLLSLCIDNADTLVPFLSLRSSRGILDINTKTSLWIITNNKDAGKNDEEIQYTGMAWIDKEGLSEEVKR